MRPDCATSNAGFSNSAALYASIASVYRLAPSKMLALFVNGAAHSTPSHTNNAASNRRSASVRSPLSFVRSARFTSAASCVLSAMVYRQRHFQANVQNEGFFLMQANTCSSPALSHRYPADLMHGSHTLRCCWDPSEWPPHCIPVQQQRYPTEPHAEQPISTAEQ